MGLELELKTLLTTVTNLYIGSMPDSPDNAVCLYVTGGYPRSLADSKFEEPTFQIKTRNTSYATGLALCDTIKDLLHGATTSKIPVIVQQSDILNIGRDEKNRQEFTINFRCYYIR